MNTGLCLFSEDLKIVLHVVTHDGPLTVLSFSHSEVIHLATLAPASHRMRTFAPWGTRDVLSFALKAAPNPPIHLLERSRVWRQQLN